MKAYKAFTINHMCKTGYSLFGVSPQTFLNPQEGDEKRIEEFMDWAIGNILGELEYPFGEFSMHILHQLLNAMSGRLIAAEPTLDPDLYWFPGGTIIASIEPMECPKCNTLMDLNEASKKQFPITPLQRMCPGCGYSCLMGKEEEYSEAL